MTTILPKGPISKYDLTKIQKQLQTECFKNKDGAMIPFSRLPEAEQNDILIKRAKKYSQNMYKKTHVFKEELRTSTVCQRENSFYIDTVKLFRDRRYEYKAMLKKSQKALAEISKTGTSAEIQSAKNLITIYDSLQVAHKVILNSFYGYVMRKGSRWFSMEIGGIICHTGSNIIKKARVIVNAIGRPLELDTDGIWAMLPSSFPDNLSISHKNGSKIKLSFPNALLNHMVAVI